MLINSVTLGEHENDIDLPYIPDDLLSELDKRFPNCCPSLTATDREIWFSAGARSVIDYLLDQRRRQKEAGVVGVVV